MDHVNARYPAPVPAQGPAPHLTGLTHRQPTSHLGKHHHTTCAYRSPTNIIISTAAHPEVWQPCRGAPPHQENHPGESKPWTQMSEMTRR